MWNKVHQLLTYLFCHLSVNHQGLEVYNNLTTGKSVVLDAPYNFIPLHVRGGSVIPMQTPSTTTTERYVSTPLKSCTWWYLPSICCTHSRKNSFQLLIAPDGNKSANGYLYLDDGESLNTTQNNNYTLLQFTLRNVRLQHVGNYWIQHQFLHF